jgi:4-amino-4-deoxy-L-arabinose transferase-like glycosyltransferase
VPALASAECAVYDAAMLARPGAHLGVLAAVALVTCLGRVLAEPLEGDPAMYGTIARTIVASGEWIHLTFNGEPYANKPPLHFWVNALVFQWLPATPLTASLVPGLFGVAGTLLLYALCRVSLGGAEPAFLAALVYALTPEVIHWSAGVHIETLVTFWILLGLLGAYRSVAEPRALIVLGVAAIGGWLAKGPQGLFPLLVAPVLWSHAGVLRARVVSVWSIAAVVLAAVTVGPWLAARLGEGTGFGATYFGEQIAQVLVAGGELQRGPLWYVGKLFRSYWPWLPVAACGIVMLARRWSSDLGARLWLVYAAVVMVVISAAVGKKSRYLFQLYPALAAASGVALAALAGRWPKLPRAFATLAVVGAAIALVVVLVAPHDEPKPRLRDTIATARGLPADAPIWLTRRTQYGEPRLGKTLGFYGPTLLRTCSGPCDTEVEPGALVVARAEETDAVVAGVGGTVVSRNETLAVVRAAPRDFVDSAGAGP